MKLFKWAYGSLAIAATICLIVSFFVDAKPITQIALLIESVGFSLICGLAIGADQ